MERIVTGQMLDDVFAYLQRLGIEIEPRWWGFGTTEEFAQALLACENREEMRAILRERDSILAEMARAVSKVRCL
jgi:hypothetical protein